MWLTKPCLTPDEGLVVRLTLPACYSDESCRQHGGVGDALEERYRVGIDIGGTFTDLVLIDDETGERSVGKTLTTPEDPSEAVEEGLLGMLEREGIEAGRLGTVVHGTTLVTNALIERRGAKTALLTTEGFRDAVAIGTEHRYDMYDIFIEKPEPLVPRSLRYGVRERILDDGSVLRELDEEQVRSVATELEEREVGAVAVSFLHGFRNPAHERRVAEILAEEAPEVTVSPFGGVAGAPGIRAHLDDDLQRLRPSAGRTVLRRLEERLLALGIKARCTSCSPTAARPAYRRPVGIRSAYWSPAPRRAPWLPPITVGSLVFPRSSPSIWEELRPKPA